MKILRSIQNRIYEIRGEKVMLDRDLAFLYETETKVLNLSVKRNIKRFPEDFMFQLTREEFESIRNEVENLDNNHHSLRFQTETSENKDALRLPIETSNTRGGTRYLPYAFTEQGIAMLSGILNSDMAINMNIAIMRAFVEVRRTLMERKDVTTQLKEIQQHISDHDAQLSQIYDAIENLLDEKSSQRKWEERDRIGFKKKE